MLLVLSASALLAAVLLFAVPAAIYFGNTTEFLYGFASYLPLFVVGGGIGIMAISLLGFLFRGRVRLIWALVVAFVAVMAAFEAFILLPNFGTLTGNTPDFVIDPVRLALEFAVAAVVTAYLILMARKPRALAVFLIGLTLLLSVPSLYMAVTENKREPQPVNEELLYGMGDKNLLVVLLDGFPSDVFEEVVELNPQLGPHLSGFTYYPDTAGIAATTYLSLPSIHAGTQYVVGEPLRPYFLSAIGEHSFLTALDEAGYDSVLMNPMLGVCPRDVYCVAPGPALGANGRILGAARLIGVALFRSAPLFLKETAYDEGRWWLPRMIDDRQLSDHNVEGVEFLKQFGERARQTSSVPTAKFIHVLTPHLPVVLGAGCEYVGVIPATRSALVQQSACALDAFARLVASLKQQGLYDQTAIVLLADHGQAAPNRKADASGDWQRLSGWANPLLAVKPIGGTGHLRSSPDARWLPEVPSIVCTILGDCSKDAPPLGNRTFNYYEWQNEFWQAETIPVEQFVLSGPPWVKESWSEAVPQH